MSDSDNNNTGEKENPFSFKHFLAASSQVDYKGVNISSSTGSAKASSNTFNDSAVKVAPAPLDDDEDNDDDLTSLPMDSNVHGGGESAFDELFELPLPPCSLPVPLPPVLPLSAFAAASTLETDCKINTSSSSNSSSSSSENERLRQKVAEQQRLIRSLESKIGELVSKEESENATLAHVVRQVEKNLHDSTIRASAAESQVVALRHENRQLRDQLAALGTDMAAARVDQARHREQLAVQLNGLKLNLASVSATAEKSLAQLTSGLSQFKLVIDTVDSFGRIVELNAETLSSASSSGD